MDDPTGEHVIGVTATDAGGSSAERRATLVVKPVSFQQEGITLDEMAAALLDPELRDAETKHLAERVWSKEPTERRWTGAFVPPIPVAVSSPYGAVRAYNSGPPGDRHAGVDLRGAKGTPVTAVAAGTVVLAEALAVRGNTVWIDHGWGVQTGYFHLDSMDVVEGESVAPGDFIGTVGATGRATGPHLHWEVRVGGRPVQPLEFLLRDVGAVP